MKKLLSLLLLASLLSGCGVQNAGKQFYVKSTPDGYVVSVDGVSGLSTGTISKPFSDPKQAQELAEKLNKNMEGNWGGK